MMIVDEIEGKSAQQLFLEKRYKIYDPHQIEILIGYNDKRVQEFYMYSTMEIHLNNVINCLDALDKVNNLNPIKRLIFSKNVLREIRFGLFQSAVIQYMKCFVEGKNYGKKKLQANQVIEDKQLYSFHDKIKNLRHDYIGHAGISESETMVVIMNFSEATIENDGYSLDYSIEAEGIFQYDFNKKELSTFRKLVEVVLNHVTRNVLTNQETYLNGLSNEELAQYYNKAIKLRDNRLKLNSSQIQ